MKFFLTSIIIMISVCGGLLFFAPQQFSCDDFVSRACCGHWSPALRDLYIRSHMAIVAAYIAIPICLILFSHAHAAFVSDSIVRRSICLLFGCCAVGHLTDVLAFTWPNYHIFAVWHAFTAAISWFAVVRMLQVACEYHDDEEGL